MINNKAKYKLGVACMALLLMGCKANENTAVNGQQAATVATSEHTAIVPLAGNAWKSTKEKAGGSIGEQGITG